MFRDRQDAGRQLADELARLDLTDTVVLALSRKGVPVAAEIAEALRAPLDLVNVRKVGSPGNPELAVAAIVDGDPPDIVLNRGIIEARGLDDADLRSLVSSERPELERRRAVFVGNRKPLSTAGKTVILVDDGAATGATMLVAARAIKRGAPRQVVIALPVAPRDVVAYLETEADRIVCLSRPDRFVALSYHYRDFPQVSDEEVLRLLEDRRRPAATPRVKAKQRQPER